MPQTEKILLDDTLNPIDDPMVLLYESAHKIANSLPVSASFVETGTRSGHASMLIFKAIRDSALQKRWFFTVDPYGNKPYGHGEHVSRTFDYGEQHYRNAMYSLSRYAWENNLNHYHYRMRSQEFHFMMDNVEFWFEEEKMDHKYGFVYLDGEHTYEAIQKELEYFLPRLLSGGMVVVDDIGMIGDKIKGISLTNFEIKYDKLWYRHA